MLARKVGSTVQMEHDKNCHKSAAGVFSHMQDHISIGILTNFTVPREIDSCLRIHHDDLNSENAAIPATHKFQG
jgi:hypothetical protein